MIKDFNPRFGMKLGWVNSVEQTEVLNSDRLQDYFNGLCKLYNVSCKFFRISKAYHTAEKETYAVFSLYEIPDSLAVKQIYLRNERSTVLFYLDYYVVKIDETSDMLSVLDSAHAYCKTADFLKRLFAEFKAPLPIVISGDEITGLKECNYGRNNPTLPLDGKSDFLAGLEKYFEQETTRSKYKQKWRDFSRTDKYNRKSSFLKMFWDFYHRDDPVVSLDLLFESNDYIRAGVINEHEFVEFRKVIKQHYPEIIFAVSKIEVENGGFDKRKNKHKPVSKIKDGPFGKLITYKAYCEERDKHFVEEGYDAIANLVPAYYETRQLYYKAIDEPIIAGVLNSIRFAYAKSVSLDKVFAFGIDMVNVIDIPTDDMMNFVSMAVANKLPYHIDFIGRFGPPNFDRLSIAYPITDDDIMALIVERLINEKFEYDRIETKP